MKSRHRLKHYAEESSTSSPATHTDRTHAESRVESEFAPAAAPLVGHGSQMNVQQMQRVVGNAAVQRMLSRTPPRIQRAGEQTGRKTLQAPLFAGEAKLEAVLNDEDRLKSGDRGEPVRKVQQGLLNDNMPLPQFGADGAYGGETSTAVKQFKSKHNLGFVQFGDVGPGTMGKLDELNTPNKPEPPVPPTPETPKDDQGLEDMLDNVWLQHQVLVDTQRDALARLDADLASQETPTDLGVEILKFIVKTAAGALFGGAGGFLSDAIKEGFKKENTSEDDQKLVGDGIDKIFEAAKGAVETAAEEKVTELMAKGEKGVDTFIDGQRATLLDASADEQEAFLVDMKPKLRKPVTQAQGDEISTEDPRISRARKLAQSIKKKRTSAFDRQYTESLAKFAVGQAQQGLGVTNNPEQGTDMSATAFEKLKGDLRGVIELDLDFDQDDPTKKVKIDEAKILGLSEKTRQRLSNMDVSLDSVVLGIPILASGTEIKLGKETELKISQNEKGELFDSGSDTEGRDWLARRGKKVKAELPDLPSSDDVKTGIDDVFREDIDKVKLKDIEDKLEKA
jgi:peptidoglycan hydrolase-like protein with peptidoglycan-binding domain